MPATLPEDIIVQHSTPVPSGYVFVPKGNVYVTKNCRRLTQSQNKPIYTVQSGKKKILGIRVPKSIYTKVLDDNRATAATRAENVRRKDQNLEDKTEAELLSRFPRIPREHVALILRHTLQKRSRRVGRSREKPLSQVVEFAVRAYIRHKLTDYDMLLRKGVDRDRARKLIQGSVNERVLQWSGSFEHARICKDNTKAGKDPHQKVKDRSTRTTDSQAQKCKAKPGPTRYTPSSHKERSRKGAVPNISRSIERRPGDMPEETRALRPVLTNGSNMNARGTIADEKRVIVISDDDDDFMDIDVIEIETDSTDDSDASYWDD